MLPSTHGREAAGTSDTATVHASETTAVTAPAAAVAPTRRGQVPGPATRNATPSAGSTSQAAAIFAWNASPTNAPASSSHAHARPGPAAGTRSARATAHVAATSNRIINGSATLPRPTATAAGLRASTNAATSPAAGPARTRTATARTTTATVISTTCGAIITHGAGPSARTASACTQNEPGSLSIVTVAAGSNAPKRKACRSEAMARTAAA